MNQSETQNISIENREKQRVIGQAQIQPENLDSANTEGPATPQQRRSTATINSVEDIDQMTDTEIHFMKISGSTKAKVKALIMAGDSYIAAKRSAIKFNFIRNRIEQKMGSRDFKNAKRKAWKKKKGKEETMSEAYNFKSQNSLYKQTIVLPRGGLQWDKYDQLERHFREAYRYEFQKKPYLEKVIPLREPQFRRRSWEDFSSGEEDNIYDTQRRPYHETIIPVSSRLQDVRRYQLETRPYQETKFSREQLKTNVQWEEPSTESLRYDFQEGFYPKTSMLPSFLQEENNALLREYSFREARHELQAKPDSMIPFSDRQEQRNSTFVEPFLREAYRYGLQSRPYQETVMSANKETLPEKFRLEELSSSEARRYEFQRRPYKETSPYQPSGLREQNNARLEECFREEYSCEPQKKPWQEIDMPRNGQRLQWSSSFEDLSFGESRKRPYQRTDMPFTVVREQDHTQLELADSCRYQPKTRLYQGPVVPSTNVQLENPSTEPFRYQTQTRRYQGVVMSSQEQQLKTNVELEKKSSEPFSYQPQTSLYQETVTPSHEQELKTNVQLEKPYSELFRYQPQTKLYQETLTSSHGQQPKTNVQLEKLSSEHFKDRPQIRPYQGIVTPSHEQLRTNINIQRSPEKPSSEHFLYEFEKRLCQKTSRPSREQQLKTDVQLEEPSSDPFMYEFEKRLCQRTSESNNTLLTESSFRESTHELQTKPYQKSVIPPNGHSLDKKSRLEELSSSEARSYESQKRPQKETIPLSDLLSPAVREQNGARLEKTKKVSSNETRMYEPKRETSQERIIPRSQRELQRNSRSQDLSSNECQERPHQEMVMPSSALQKPNAQLKPLPEQMNAPLKESQPLQGKGQLKKFSFCETSRYASQKRLYQKSELDETCFSEAHDNKPQKRPYQETVMFPGRNGDKKYDPFQEDDHYEPQEQKDRGEWGQTIDDLLESFY